LSQEDVEENPYHRRLLSGHDHAVRALAAKGRTLVSGSYDCTVRVWDIITGVVKWVLIGHTQKGTRFKLTSPHPSETFFKCTVLFMIRYVIKLRQVPWMELFVFGIWRRANVCTY
jgi:hypothetical protein